MRYPSRRIALLCCALVGCLFTRVCADDDLSFEQFLIQADDLQPPTDGSVRRLPLTDPAPVDPPPLQPPPVADSQTVPAEAAADPPESPPPPIQNLDAAMPDNMISSQLRTQEFDSPATTSMNNDFTKFPDFVGGILIEGERAAMKIGGYVKADFISDFDPIDSTDSFDTTTIPIGAPPRRNARFHARQSRLSFDTRWKTGGEVMRAFIEADFFGDGSDGSNAFRLRHAYGTYGRFTAGQTWTTFTDPSAVPNTLDFEGAVSNVNRRQGLVRWTQPILWDGLSLAAALENPRINFEIPSGVQGVGRTESPDVIARLRYEQDWGEFQSAMVLRELGFQPVDQDVITGTAWGFNFTGSVMPTDTIKGYYQITFGEGIGSYRGSPDVIATGPDTASILPMFGWMVGCKREWSDRWSSNLTYSRLDLEAIPGQAPDNLRSTTYLAVNLINTPYERVFWGIEYLYGIRENQSGARADANRVQMSFGFLLP
ncbi:porin [Stieleria sp. TO1_6]|uniref:DcaP family trimeric outer membrane transporter n=1 Tax=Stieleria tagensis TaxID=2956795 RepID=UPI00209B5D28|nr:DcaP family trimeric outer membrane transporter [Stieleria tagensis]MCO8122813.1 porin [Stieleria tagensis]